MTNTQPNLTALLIAASHHPKLTRRTGRELAMLALLNEPAPTPWGTKELAKALGVGKPVITRAMHTLQREGLAYNTTRHKDKRRRSITLSDAGRDLVGDLLGEARTSHDAIAA